MIAYSYDLDMTPGERPLRIHLNQHDEDFQLLLRLFSDRGDLDIKSGTTAKIRGTTPGGQSYIANASISSGVVTVIGDENMCDAAGIGVYEICLTKDNKELYSSNFFVIVERIAKD